MQQTNTNGKKRRGFKEGGGENDLIWKKKKKSTVSRVIGVDISFVHAEQTER